MAKIISIIFHPLLMPSLGMLIILTTGRYMMLLPFEAQRSIFLVVFITTFLLPLSVIPFFVFGKIINNPEMNQRQERFIPLLVTTLLIYVAYYLLTRISVPQIMSSFVLASFISLFCVLIINIRFKISLHMIGIGGIIGLLIALLLELEVLRLYLLAGSIIAAGLLGTARLILEVHKPLEIYAGFLFGIVVVLGSMLVL